MDDSHNVTKFAVHAAVYLAAGSLVGSEVLQAALMRPGDPSLLRALRALEAPRSDHTDPEQPQQPDSLWPETIAGSTSSSISQGFGFETYVPK
jgi:hypothetical protein